MFLSVRLCISYLESIRDIIVVSFGSHTSGTKMGLDKLIFLTVSSTHDIVVDQGKGHTSFQLSLENPITSSI